MKGKLVLLSVSALTLLGLAPATAMGAVETFTVTNTTNGDPGSLRDAIIDSNANDNTDVDKIVFDPAVVGETIEVTGFLPSIEENTAVDACSSVTDPVNPCVGLRFDGVPSGAGLSASGPIVTIEGFAVTNFAFGITSSFSTLIFVAQNNWVGVKLDGTVEGNTLTGIASNSTTAGNVTIGGGGSGQGNVIADSGATGIAINGADSGSIRGNRIGVTAGGIAAGNTNAGILIQEYSGIPATDISIGGNTDAEENVISNNGGDAITIDDENNLGADGNFVRRNRGSGNGGLFIDLTPDDGLGVSLMGPNQGVLPPSINKPPTSESASGVTEPGAMVRLFFKASPADGRLDQFIGIDEADGTGAWSMTYPPLPPTGFVAATTSVTGIGTSEISATGAYIDVTPRPTATQPPAATARKKCKKGRKLVKRKGKKRCVKKKRR